MHNSGNLHKRATHSPVNAVGYTVPATVLVVRRLRDGTPPARAVHSKPAGAGIDVHIVALPAVAPLAVDRGRMPPVAYAGRERPMVDRVSLHKPPDSVVAEQLPTTPLSLFAVVVRRVVAVVPVLVVTGWVLLP